MSKVTKKELLERIEFIESWMNGADEMLTELNHALPDPEYDAKCEAAVAGVEASLDRHRERLGLNKPQLKQLTQSVFDGLDEKWRFAAVDEDGTRCDYETRPQLGRTQWNCVLGGFRRHVGEHDTSNWQNSLIERDIAKELLEVDLSSELTGSELCKAMLERGDKIVLCIVGDYENEDDVCYDAITGCSNNYFDSTLSSWRNATPINNQGEPLTQAEAGL